MRKKRDLRVKYIDLATGRTEQKRVKPVEQVAFWRSQAAGKISIIQASQSQLGRKRRR